MLAQTASHSNNYSVLTRYGLFFCAAGDWFLFLEDSGGELFFLLGLLSFLVGHLFFAVSFDRNRKFFRDHVRRSQNVLLERTPFGFNVTIIVYAILMGYLLLPHIDAIFLKIGVVLYAAIISLMLKSASDNFFSDLHMRRLVSDVRVRMRDGETNLRRLGPSGSGATAIGAPGAAPVLKRAYKLALVSGQALALSPDPTGLGGASGPRAARLGLGSGLGVGLGQEQSQEALLRGSNEPTLTAGLGRSDWRAQGADGPERRSLQRQMQGQGQGQEEEEPHQPQQPFRPNTAALRWSDDTETSASLAALGALIFVVSDSFLGFHKFVAPTTAFLSPLTVMTTYWTAITLIAAAAARQPSLLWC
jgi:uncharacterized membrane protein YhhN